MEMVAALGIAIVLFATTNVDDIFVLVSFFADKSFSARHVVLGQYAGIIVLVGVSLVASLISLVLDREYIGLLGLLPILIGAKKLWDIWSGADNDDEVHDVGTKASGWGNVLSVMSVTVANGGDNIGIYTPVFATSTPAALGVFVVVFLVVVGIWLAAAHWLVNHPSLGAPIRKWGYLVTPWVLIAVGIFVLYENGSLGLPSLWFS